MRKKTSFLYHSKQFLSLSIFIFLFLLSSCKKDALESSLNTPPLASETNAGLLQSDGAGATLEASSCALPYLNLFSNHFRNHRGADPSAYFPAQPYADFVQQIGQKKALMESTGGLNTYTNQLVQEEKITLATQELLLHMYESALKEEAVDPDFLAQELTEQYSLAVIQSDDPLFCYIYHLALEIYQNYYNNPNSASSRGGCEFKEFLRTLVENIAAGIDIGTAAGEELMIVESFVVQIVGGALYVAGGLIGAAIGAVTGIFDGLFSDNNCDCSEVDGLSVLSEDDCDLTRTVLAWGAGDDVALYHWTILQGTEVLEIFTTVNKLSITQLIEDEPIIVAVDVICQNGETTIITSKEIDLATNNNSVLGQVGELTLSYQCPYEDQWGNFVNNCFDIDADVVMTFNSTNDISGHIEYQYELLPADMGEVTFLNDHKARISWERTGQAEFVVTATNSCTGLTATISESMNVTN